MRWSYSLQQQGSRKLDSCSKLWARKTKFQSQKIFHKIRRFKRLGLIWISHNKLERVFWLLLKLQIEIMLEHLAKLAQVWWCQKNCLPKQEMCNHSLSTLDRQSKASEEQRSREVPNVLPCRLKMLSISAKKLKTFQRNRTNTATTHSWLSILREKRSWKRKRKIR